MASMMALLGSFHFGIETAAYQQLERASTYRWAEQKRIGRESGMQYTGRDSETISLSGYILTTFRGGLAQLPALRAAAAAGKPMQLSFGFGSSGTSVGQWVITEVRETQTIFFSNGAPRRIDFAITLKEYGG